MSQQLNESKRFVLAELLQLNIPKTQIAKRLGIHRSTVHRELKRNTSDPFPISVPVSVRESVRV